MLQRVNGRLVGTLDDMFESLIAEVNAMPPDEQERVKRMFWDSFMKIARKYDEERQGIPPLQPWVL